jgi:multidrug efflux system membrane fusion protein
VATRLLVDTVKQAMVAPNDAVERGPNGLYAFVVGDNNKIEMHEIKVGQEGESESVITQGLSPGQKVVVAGQSRLAPGALVAPTEANPMATAQNAPPKAP